MSKQFLTITQAYNKLEVQGGGGFFYQKIGVNIY